MAAITIDRDAEVPIGVQLAWALRARIGGGELQPGQRLPGLRDLAEAIGVNLNTVRAVYQRLEQEGLIESQQGSGTFVAPEPTEGPAAGAIAATAARAARETGVDPRQVAAALYVAAEPSQEPVEQRSVQPADISEVGQRRLLRRQIAAFESALGEIEAANPGVAPPAARPRTSGGPALLSTQQLEQVRTRLVRRLAIVQAAIDEETARQESTAAAAAAAAERTPKRSAATAPKPTEVSAKRRRPHGGGQPLPASS